MGTRSRSWQKKNQKIDPIEFIRRPGFRHGLGHAPTLPEGKEKKYIKPGESREIEEPKVLPIGPDGKVRNYRKLDEELVPLSKAGFAEGTPVLITTEKYSNEFATVVSIADGKLEVSLEIDKNKIIKINREDAKVV